jgi:crossover junction endodeoxyribonuclease RusA
MYFNTRNGGKVLTYKAQQYIRDAKALINLAIEEQNWLKQEYAVWYYIDLVFYMPDRRIRDSHNMLKLLLDVMQETIFHNDYFVMPRVQSVEYDNNHSRIEISITPQTSTQRARGVQVGVKTREFVRS